MKRENKNNSSKLYFLFLQSVCLVILSGSILWGCSLKKPIPVIEKTYCNKTENPLGIETIAPQFSWLVKSAINGAQQSAFRILVSESKEELLGDSGILWDSGKMESDQSIGIPYEGDNLQTESKYYWKVKVWDQNGNESEWSKISFWQMGLLSADDWEFAEWIGYEELDSLKLLVDGVTGYGDISMDKVEDPAIVPFFRKEFELNDKIECATLSISGLGHYEASINGQKVSDNFLAPGWTDYEKTVLYNSYDVTQQLNEGLNCIGVMVGNGFYYNNRERYRKLIIAYGFPKLIGKLKVHYKNGTSKTIVSDASWKTLKSPITYSSIYGGEDYDARMEQKGWDNQGFDAENWEPVTMVTPPSGKLVSDLNTPVKVMQSIEPVSFTQINDSVVVYDFGQNLSGIIDLKIKGEQGQKVILHPAEVLKENGTVNQRGSGSPYYFTYTLKGDAEENWRPRFTYYGFRYVQVTYPSSNQSGNKTSDNPKIISLKSLHTRNSAPTVGTFSCSNELFNQINKMINWAIASNTQSVSTDCPTREKLGWLEQTHLMGESMHFRLDVYHLFQKLVNDMMDAQTEDGLVPNIVPEYINFDYFDASFRDSPEWGIATIMVPWTMYKWYGNKQVLETAWPMMEQYLGYLSKKSDNFILSHGLGDWYDIGPEPPGYAQLTPVSLVATATYYYDALLMAKMADVLNKPTKKKDYMDLSGKIFTAFNDQFYNEEKCTYSTGSQTALAMPISLGLVPEENKEKVIQNLFKILEENAFANTTGDIGFYYLMDALAKNNGSEIIYKMNNRDDVPGYGYQLKKGMTALTESWMALDVKSLNHLMLGHIMEWFYSGLGGIRQVETSVAYKNIIIHPEIVEDISFVDVSFDSPYGTIRSNWEKTDANFNLKIEIPFNTTAKIYLPVIGDVQFTSDKNSVPKFIGEENGRLVYETGSGNYEFSVRKSN